MTARLRISAALIALWLLAGYALALRLAAAIPWPEALWQAVVCLLFALPLLSAVIAVLSFPKRLIRYWRGGYQAIAPVLIMGQFALPWLGWAALIWSLNRGRLNAPTALAAACAVTLYSYATGFAVALLLRPRASDVRLTRLEVALPGLPPAFDGYRILHISDAHGGCPLARTGIAERLALARGLQPDLVAFTGDLAARRGALGPAAAALGALTAADGRIAVLGNHDHLMGEERVARALFAAGFTLLLNTHLVIERNGERLVVAGVLDASQARQHDLAAALRGAPEQSPIILLSHSPDIVTDPLAARASLVLAGHTHGGQVALPWIGPLYLPTRLGRRYAAGSFSVAGRPLFITRGLGEVFPPLRLNCPPEIALIVLRAPCH